jgi:general secretion pathway protein G
LNLPTTARVEPFGGIVVQDSSYEGFTLLEILVVVAIIGLLATLVSVKVLPQLEINRLRLAKVQMRRIEGVLDLYKLDAGAYPSTDQGLAALVRQPVDFPERARYQEDGYLEPDALRDPWERAWLYESPGRHNSRRYDLASLGPDGRENGPESDDITNWEALPR